jgi:hypothetical protein
MSSNADRPFRFLASRAIEQCPRALLVVALGAMAGVLDAQTLAGKAKESGCVDAPRLVEGATFRCNTSSGAAAYFNVPGYDGGVPDRSQRRSGNASGAAPSPLGFPRVDADTQKGRDDMRRKVLGDEITAEQTLLAESRAAYANGAPAATPEERASPQKYADRIAKLRDTVRLHERNIELLKKELAGTR